MRIIDVVSFAGELDMLELRLNILDSVVDEFIVCEGDETTAGNPKPRYFEENKERYAKWLPKIKYFIMAPYTDPALTLLADTSPGVPKDMHWWKREYIQKESMRYALTHLKDDDKVFIGDVDEIWNLEIVIKHKEALAILENNQHSTTSNPERIAYNIKKREELEKQVLRGRYELEQLVYSYYLNNRSSEAWTGTSVMDYKDIKNDTLDNLRAYDVARTHMHAPRLPNAGWHFTNCGGAEFIKKKLQSYAHQEFNQDFILNQVEQRIADNEDYLGRDFTFKVDESQWPQYLKDNREKYLHLLK